MVNREETVLLTNKAVKGAQLLSQQISLCWPLTFPKWLCLHLQADLDEVHRASQPDRDHTGHRTSQEQVGHTSAGTIHGLPSAVPAEEPLGVAEDPEYHGVVDSDTG